MKLNLIDNAIPAGLIENIDDTKPLSIEILGRLADEPGIWNEPSLRTLVQEVLSETDWLDIRGYTNPEFFFSDKERVENKEGGMVLLDWDTGMDGVRALRETINTRPNDGIFIITGFDTSSRVSEQVGEHFGDTARRIAIYRKGEGTFSFLRMLGKFYEMPEAGVIVGRRILTDSGPSQQATEAGLSCVWYATNRRPSNEDPPAFGTDRDRGSHYGRAYVRVNHRAAVVSKWTIPRFFKLAPRRTEFTYIDPLPKADFFQVLGARMRQEGPGESDFLLFVHGFNVLFAQAVETIAQISFDIRFPGQVGIFSWPSLGDQSKSGYMADKERAVHSIDLLSAFLIDLAKQDRISRLHIIAHSMGNFVLLNALDRLFRIDGGSLKGRLGELILVAADVESPWFIEHEFSAVTERTTVYVSEADWALLLARDYQQQERLGLIPPITCGKGCDTVDTSVCTTPFAGFGHDYYAESTRLLGDLALVLQGHPIDRRPALERRETLNASYWALQPMS